MTRSKLKEVVEKGVVGVLFFLYLALLIVYNSRLFVGKKYRKYLL